MFKKHYEVKKKILLYYFLAIVLPSIILGFLAFRGLINDQAKKEKESRQVLSEIATSLIEQTDLIITEIEEQFNLNSKVRNVSFAHGGTFKDSILSEFCENKQVIKSIIHADTSGEFHLLNAGLLFFPDGTLGDHNITSMSINSSALGLGWKYEFQDKNYPQALSYYRDVLKNTKPKSSKVHLLFTIARIQKKQQKFKDAVNTFRLIEDAYHDEKLEGGLPVGIAALMETSKLYLSTGDTLNALKSTVELLTKTSEYRFKLEVSHYNHLVSTCSDIIDASKHCAENLCHAQQEKANSILEKLKMCVENTLQQWEMLDAISSDFRGDGGHSPNGESDYRVYTNHNQLATFYSVLPESEKGRWMIIYNLEELLTRVTQDLIPEMQEAEYFKWKVLKEGREMLKQSSGELNGGIKTTSVFPNYLPSWSLVLVKEPTNLIASFLNASQGVFLYIFLFIVIGLSLGLIFTLQVINKELLLSKMKSDFISTVSHEFKSPLTSIRQMTEMLYNDRIKEEPRKKEYYTVMLEQTERLSHLIDNILDFSRIEEGKKAFRFQKSDIKELVTHVKSVYQRSIEDEGFTISLSVPEKAPLLVIDRDAIQQVIYNLLDNAYKYSGESKEIRITVALSDNSIKIAIQDFGIGIGSDDRNKIFDRFYRGGKALSRSIKGSGIGLTIVKRIVEAHHGNVAFESTPGKGSIFYVTLPV